MAIDWRSLYDADTALTLPNASTELFEAFVKANNIKKWAMVTNDVESLPFIINRKRGRPAMRPTHQKEYNLHLDHPRLYQTEDKLRIFVAHCYLYGDEAKAEFKRELDRFAADNGLGAEVYDPTFDWYFYTASLVVIHQPFLDVQATSQRRKCILTESNGMGMQVFWFEMPLNMAVHTDDQIVRIYADEEQTIPTALVIHSQIIPLTNDVRIEKKLGIWLPSEDDQKKMWKRWKNH